MNREFIDAGIKLHVTVESKDALRKLENWWCLYSIQLENRHVKMRS